ncbi:T9SS type A sorting domain-containing protein [Flavobacterium sp. Fl-318]|uniref:T9SS type A sorting domain-containing protein n=1 Tax=Flavobacterium cupriresistens TaxID=2893885 RepID=A0ABU4RJC0_9FLAO|nr:MULTISPECIES: T9SS type A sorting domain-containing protein [unclassified Flavobacterium]MDX6190621.1 T9SS type A sorting domain-containing protein [Flavobacterium sp. Fl-318]UFH43681.1 T9SS type A sorting domain-containing protein [Flavobacterium sp. F-323]
MKTKLLLFLVLAHFSIYAQINLVSNGEFENWTNNKTLPGWTIENNVSQNTSDFWRGANSIKLSFLNNTLIPKITTQVPMSAGITYTIKFKYKYLSSNYNNAHPIVLNISKNGSSTTLSNTTFATDNNWGTNEITFTPDQNLSYDLSISLLTNDAIGFNVAIDNLQVYVQGTEQYTLIPDVIFETKLIRLGIDLGVTDGRVLTSSIATLNSLDVSNNQSNLPSQSIINMTGIQDFKALTSLSCFGNLITSLDLTKNSALTTLYCQRNRLTNLDISKNTALTYINCNDNQLTNIDVSEKKALTYLNCSNNKLTNLTVSKSVPLEYLYCEINALTSLDVSKNVSLKALSCRTNSLTSLNLKNGKNTLFYWNSLYNIEVYDNPGLSCILVDDVIYSNKNWSNKKDYQARYTLLCDQQYTAIPDLNFEKKLIALLIDAGPTDGKVLTASISSQTTLDVSNSAIADLTGIQDFTKLSTLNCSGNTLRNPDFSKNLNLTNLDCSKNQLSSLDFTKNSALTTLRCSNNIELATLEVSKNSALTVLECKSANLRALNVTQNLKLEELNCSYNILARLDVSKNIHLTSLDCSYNRVPELNISNHQSLITLNCSNNELTSLDVSSTMSLNNFDCSTNKLVNLNVKNGNNLNMPKPKFLSNPNLTCISVDKVAYSNSTWSSSKDKAASYNTSCGTSIAYTLIPDPAFEDKLIAIGIDTDGKNGKIMTTSIISVTSLDASSANISNLGGIQDFLSLTYLDCGLNKISYLNLSKNIFLATLYAPENALETLDVSKNTDLTYLDCSKNRLKTLDVSKNKALTYLNLSMNSLYSNFTTLDVSNNTALTTLNFSNNKITTIDLTKNPALTAFNCNTNSIEYLDASKNTALVKLDCYGNRLWYLNLKNGNNKNLDIANSNFTNNLNLSCIEVDDPAYSNANWSGKKDAAASFNEACNLQNTLIPDINFEEKLIALKIDSGVPDGKVSTARISFVTELNLNGASISDLTGIQDFTALTSLFCTNNLLTTINISQNLDLTYLNVNDNKLTTIETSNNPVLEELYISDNKLTSLNLAKNLKLHDLFCMDNQLTTLDVSSNKELYDLRCSSNQLKILDLSKNRLLDLIYCSNNDLSALNLKSGGNKYIRQINLIENPSLSCILVDDVSYSNTNWANFKDATANFKTVCDALGLEDSVFKNTVVYPNPTKNILNIQNVSLEKATVYNALGQLVKTFTLDATNTDNTINLSGLPKGIYYVYLINQDAASAKKIILE